jgi:putative DNA primase/helicase
MIGGIQPNLLRKHMGESGAALQDDGMLPRFQLLVWPDLDPEYRYIDRAPNTKARSRLEHLYSTLTMLDESDPIKLRFRNDAQDHFQWWFEGLENRIRSGDLPLDLASHLGKYRSLMPTLAALFELASCGFDGFEGTKGTKRVSLENALRAVTWCGYLESHARRIYSLRPSPEEKAATDLIAKIKSGMVGSDRFFTSRDVAQCGWKGLNGPEQVHKATEVLVKTGWIREATLPVSPKGGRPSQRFEINPRIWNEL